MKGLNCSGITAASCVPWNPAKLASWTPSRAATGCHDDRQVTHPLREPDTRSSHCGAISDESGTKLSPEGTGVCFEKPLT